MIEWILVVQVHLGSVNDEAKIGSYPSKEVCEGAGKYWTADPSGGQLQGVKFTCTQRTKS